MQLVAKGRCLESIHPFDSEVDKIVVWDWNDCLVFLPARQNPYHHPRDRYSQDQALLRNLRDIHQSRWENTSLLFWWKHCGNWCELFSIVEIFWLEYRNWSVGKAARNSGSFYVMSDTLNGCLVVSHGDIPVHSHIMLLIGSNSQKADLQSGMMLWLTRFYLWNATNLIITVGDRLRFILVVEAPWELVVGVPKNPGRYCCCTIHLAHWRLITVFW